ncbi:MAG: biotin--[acetyl-CoA-carboxylase] ligase [Flavobacteriaceae bacterium]|nr:biotin--[acetyl-CoA-carboxylase] ligase [Flavobacteriaceae bacterium]
MHIIKLSATDSTNSYLRNKSLKELVQDYTVIVTDHQTKGRGQMGTKWNSQAGKNLVFSVFKDVRSLCIEYPFYLSMITSLSIKSVLKKINVPNIRIKWPNDIMSDNKKICGVLIENVYKKNKLNSSIIGIGLNVNQTQFTELPQASSLKLQTGVHFNSTELLIMILDELKINFSLYDNGHLQDIKKEYETNLFSIDKASKFKSAHGNMFSGYIKGIADSGKLKILTEGREIKEFDLKEVQLLY